MRWTSIRVKGIWSLIDKSRKFLEVWLCIYYHLTSEPSLQLGSLCARCCTSPKRVKMVLASDLWPSCCSCLLPLYRSFGEVLSCQKMAPYNLHSTGPTVPLGSTLLCAPASQLATQYRHWCFLFPPTANKRAPFFQKRVSFSIKNQWIRVVFFMMFPWGVSSAFPQDCH